LCDLPTSPSDIASSGQVSPDGHIGYHQASVRYTCRGEGNFIPFYWAPAVACQMPIHPLPLVRAHVASGFKRAFTTPALKVLPWSCCPAVAIAGASPHQGDEQVLRVEQLRGHVGVSKWSVTDPTRLAAGLPDPRRGSGSGGD